MKKAFLLNPNITFLNFGSFGACPKPIFNAYQNYQLKLENEPVHFITEEGINLVQRSKKALGNFLDCDGQDLILVPNPTYAINIIADQLGLKKGDEILSTNLEYGAMDKLWDFYALKLGFIYKRSNISLPIKDKTTFLEEFWASYSKKTKVIFISHITSATGLILPVEEICIEARKRGLIIIIDGAHAPGHIPLSIKKLDPDFYTGACHKWMMTPKGCSFLFAKKNWQNKINPMVISWGYDPNKTENIWEDFHQFNGTRDFSAYLTVPDAIAFMHKNNWSKKSKKCHELGLKNYLKFCKILKAKPLAPLNSNYFGQLFSTEIKTNDPIGLKKVLYDDYKIQIPVIVVGEKIFLRYSIQVFNNQKELDYLFKSLKEIKLKKKLL